MCYNYTMPKNEPDIYPYAVTDISSKDAIIIAPHPDDESLGCGGSIIKHIRAKSRVKVVFLTNGGKGDFQGKFGKEYVEIRKSSARQAMGVLGVEDFEFWSYEDRDLSAAARKAEEKLHHTVRSFSPSILYAPSPLEAHPDHKSAFQIVWNLRKQFRISYAFYEVLMALYPNALVDITEEMEQKKKAIESYHTEIYYNDYVTKVLGLNRFRTSTLPKSVRYSEAFFLIESHMNIQGTAAYKYFKAATE
jgi:LmbE family N-acetylglucosaminyl deacetylase